MSDPPRSESPDTRGSQQAPPGTGTPPGTGAHDDPLLDVRDLRVSFDTDAGEVRAVAGVSLCVRRGEIVALVGESGSGKSVTALTLTGLTRRLGARIEGSATFEGQELLAASEAQLRRLRGARIAMVFQDPLSSLNPVTRVGAQIAEQIRAHEPRVSGAQAAGRAVALLDRVGIAEAARRVRSYPHELSGGMRQRVMIAMALSCDPSLLIADEPTTALDVTTQAQILAQLRALRAHSDAAILLVTHDIGVVADLADRILVMHAGRIVEHGRTREILHAARHPYTQTLLAAHSGAPARAPRAPGPALLAADALEVRFRARRRTGVHALHGVSLTLGEGETLAVVGESGAGKTTLIRCLMRLMDPTSGIVSFRGADITNASRRQLLPVRRELQMVFQDAHASLNPRRRVQSILQTGLQLRGVRGAQLRPRARELLARVGLGEEHLERYPHELSGGQRQRVGIARALSCEPRAIVLDEPVSALDAPLRAQVLDLLVRLQAQSGLSYLLVAHDLAVVRRVADRIAVMRAGEVVELAGAEELFAAPRHPYTRELLAASPDLSRELAGIGAGLSWEMPAAGPSPAGEGPATGGAPLGGVRSTG
ncbi:MAG TPA: ABC transporter ATP-binding protein [Solirubrobacteraceae bacterium]|jgi:peptide/nickel transport system ATP-binding protein